MRAFFVIVFALFALLAVPIAIFSLHARIKILLLAAVPCIFRPQSPVSKNECMHRCNNFVNFVYDLLFSLCLPCFEHLFLQKNILFTKNMLPALGGKHDFESGTKAKSWKMCLLSPPIMPVCTLFAPLIATWNLQNPLQKCVVLVYNPFSEATFNIVCFIARLYGDISTFSLCIWPHFVKKCSPPSVGSMILKAAHNQIHENYASEALRLGQYASFLHLLLQSEICKIHWTKYVFSAYGPCGETNYL